MSDKNKKQITELTPEQEAQLDIYFAAGIEMGLSAKPDFDESLVRDAIQKHRVMCGEKPAIHFRIYDSPQAAIKNETGLTRSNAIYGQHDAGWLMNYAFYREVLGLREETEELIYLIELAKHLGWYWMGVDTVILTRQPEEVHTRPGRNPADPKLHNVNGPAIKYRDGFSLYYMNDIYIPEEYSWVCNTSASDLDVKKILKISNTEVRTEAMKKVGLEKFLDQLSSNILDEASIETNQYKLEIEGFIQVTSHYKLHKFDLPNSETSRIYLEMRCPSSTKFHFEGVHPDCKSVVQALSWRETGIISSDYQIPGQRT